MYFKTSLSPHQLLYLWSALSACYYEEGRYDVNSCEIYFYSLLPSSPFADQSSGSLGNSEREKREGFAAQELSDVLSHFCSEMDCEVSIYDSKPRETGFYSILSGYSTRVVVAVHRKKGK